MPLVTELSLGQVSRYAGLLPVRRVDHTDA
jgi:hypothetical protein